MNHPLSYPFTHQLIYSFTHTILSIYAIGKISPRIFACSECSAVRRIGQSDKKMLNEPNLKNTKINVKSFMEGSYANFNRFQQQKNEPKTNPILSTGLSIDQFEQKMQNEPNFKLWALDFFRSQV